MILTMELRLYKYSLIFLVIRDYPPNINSIAGIICVL